MHIHLLGIVLLVISTLGVAFGMSYTASQSQSGQGTKLEINQGNASPPVWTQIAEPLGCMFGDKNMFDDSTNLSSTDKEFLAILRDPGKVSVDLNRVSSDPGQVKVNADFRANPPTRSQYRVTLPINTAAGQSSTGDTFVFLGYVDTYTPDIKTDKKVVSKFTIQVTGAITFTQGS